MGETTITIINAKKLSSLRTLESQLASSIRVASGDEREREGASRRRKRGAEMRRRKGKLGKGGRKGRVEE